MEGEADRASQAVVPEQPVEDPFAPAEGEALRGELEVLLDRLDSRLGESQRLLARQTELTERLHAENQGLRVGELRNAQMPLVRDLIRLTDDLERMRDVATESVEDLRMVHEGLLDILARNGIERLGTEHGEPFDPRAHNVAGTEPTTDEQLDRAVAAVVRPGFRWESGEVIRVAEVRAYRFTGSG
ncbi:MAG TPA: nucleotide exchange factor GrpE [Solirubrobacterales bacterium]|nr:nucleotide exchange factor GrpE [Solirubrobacterales bacterium]